MWGTNCIATRLELQHRLQRAHSTGLFHTSVPGAVTEQIDVPTQPQLPASGLLHHRIGAENLAKLGLQMQFGSEHQAECLYRCGFRDFLDAADTFVISNTNVYMSPLIISSITPFSIARLEVLSSSQGVL